MINVFSANIGQEEIDEIQSSLNASWMGMGQKVNQFETEIVNRNHLNGLAMVDSGSNALYLAIRLLGLPPKSSIIVPSFTWVACANAVRLAGHRIVFADVDYDTQNITEKTVAQVINHRVRAIMAVHYAGKPANISRLKTFGVPVIEDAAHAIDSKINNIYCGNIGDVGIYSFDAVKNLATPEGGAIIGPPELIQKAKEFRYCGVQKSGFANQNANRWWEAPVKHVAPKMIPNDICASVGLAQLHKLNYHQQRRKNIWDRYQDSFKALSWLKIPMEAETSEQHSYFTYLIRILDGSRDQLAKYLLSNNVYTTLRYHPLHLNKIYRHHGSLPICEQLSEEGLNLPLHPAMSDGDIDKVIDLVLSWPCKK